MCILFIEYSIIIGEIELKSVTAEQYLLKANGGGRWIRTIEGVTSRFTVCPLWPLGNPTTRKCIGAGKGSRTPITSLEGWGTTVMPYPQLTW